jgi:hypothetical protein
MTPPQGENNMDAASCALHDLADAVLQDAELLYSNAPFPSRVTRAQRARLVSLGMETLVRAALRDYLRAKRQTPRFASWALARDTRAVFARRPAALRQFPQAWLKQRLSSPVLSELAQRHKAARTGALDRLLSRLYRDEQTPLRYWLSLFVHKVSRAPRGRDDADLVAEIWARYLVEVYTPTPECATLPPSPSTNVIPFPTQRTKP